MAAWPGRVGAADHEDVARRCTPAPRCASRRSRRPRPRELVGAGRPPAAGSRRRWRRPRRGPAISSPPASATDARRSARPRGRTTSLRPTSISAPKRWAWAMARRARSAPRQPDGEAEVVLDARALAGLAARGVALDHHRAQALRRAVDRGGQPGRPAADHHQVVEAAPRRACVSPTRSATSRSAGALEHPPSGNTSTGRRAGSVAGRGDSRAASASRSTSSQRYGTWLRARKSLQLVRLRATSGGPTTRMPSNGPRRARPASRRAGRRAPGRAAPRAGPRASSGSGRAHPLIASIAASVSA